MNKIMYLGVAIVIVVGAFIVLKGGGEDIQEVMSGDSNEVAEQATSSGNRATDYNSSRSNRTTAVAVYIDTDGSGDGEVSNDVDNDCDDPHGDTSRCAEGDPVPDIGITEEQSGGVSTIDSDDDGDSVPTDDSAGSEAQVEGYVKIDDVKGESKR